MKTHELAKQLVALAKALRDLPNMEIDGLRKLKTGNAEQSIAVGLTTLVSLSDIDKAQWIDFIKLNNLPIDVRSRDASRDIIGKILNYLQADKEARSRLALAAQSSRSTTSPELQRALDILLKP